MPDGIPRSVLALTGIVAIVAISVGIKDYMQPKRATTPESANAQVATADAATSKSSTSTKKSRASSSSATKVANAKNAQKAGVEETYDYGDASPRVLVASVQSSTAKNRSQSAAAVDGNDSAMDGNEQGWPQNKAAANAFSATGCLPLPNLTAGGDVDAYYYQNWAREYCGRH